MSQVDNSEKDRIVVFASDLRSLPVTGATINLIIQNIANGEFFNGAAFQVAFTSVVMSQTDITNKPGEYHYDFISSEDNIRVVYRGDPLGSVIVNGPFFGEAQVGLWIDDVQVSKKYTRNKVTIAGNNYTVFENDGSTVFEAGTIASSGRTPP